MLSSGLKHSFSLIETQCVTTSSSHLVRHFLRIWVCQERLWGQAGNTNAWSRLRAFCSQVSPGLPDCLTFQGKIETLNETPRFKNSGSYRVLQGAGREAVRARQERPVGRVCLLDRRLQGLGPLSTCVWPRLMTTVPALVLVTLLYLDFKPRCERNDHVLTKQQRNWCGWVKYSVLRT